VPCPYYGRVKLQHLAERHDVDGGGYATCGAVTRSSRERN
jgi:hypothetical protein